MKGHHLVSAMLLENVLTTGTLAAGLVEDDQLHGLHAVRMPILWSFSVGNISDSLELLGFWTLSIVWYLGVLDPYVEGMMLGWDSYVPGGIRVRVKGLDRGGISRRTCWGCPGLVKL
jgi:hypothetical protein